MASASQPAKSDIATALRSRPVPGLSEARTAGARVPPAAPWSDGRVMLFGVIWAELAVLALFLSLAAHNYADFPGDAGLAAAIDNLKGTVIGAVIIPAGQLQWFLPTGIAMALIFGTLLALGQYRALLCCALSTFATDLINVAINTVVARPRPHGERITTLVSNLGQQSYPSGHVAHTVGLYGFVFYLCVLAIRADPRWTPLLRVVQAICVYFIAFVGLSRIMEGAHWPSDVLGGYLVGTLGLLAAIALYHYLSVVRKPRAAAPTAESAGSASAMP